MDALNGQLDQVLTCEVKFNTGTVLSCGFAAVGPAGVKNVEDAWVEGFRGFQNAGGRSIVYLVLDADKARGKGSRTAHVIRLCWL